MPSREETLVCRRRRVYFFLAYFAFGTDLLSFWLVGGWWRLWWQWFWCAANQPNPHQQFPNHNYKWKRFTPALMHTIYKGYFVIACNSIFANIFRHHYSVRSPDDFWYIPENSQARLKSELYKKRKKTVHFASNLVPYFQVVCAKGFSNSI